MEVDTGGCKARAIWATSPPIAAEVAQEVYSDAEEEIAENDTVS